MLLCIIKKEIQNGFLNLRVPFTLLLVTAVMASTSFLFLEDYQQQLADHDRNTKDNLQKVSQRAVESERPLTSVFSRSHQWVYRAPSRLAFLAAGHEKDLPNAFEVNAFTIRNPTRRLRENSLLVYNSISGERESGTLRLSMSNPVPRSTLLLGKYMGIMIMLIVPLLTGMLISMIIITTSSKTNLADADWLRILIMLFLSLLYLSIFVLLGLFISSSIRSSSASLVILLLVWTVIVVVIPSVTGVIATRFSKLPSDRTLSLSVESAQKKADQEYGARHPESARNLSGSWFSRDSLGKHLYRNDATMAVYKDYWDGMVANVQSGYNVTRISPCVIYRRAVESTVGTGIDHYESFIKQIWQYKSLLRDFLISHHPLDFHKQYVSGDEQRKAFQACSKVKFTGADVPRFHDDPIPAGDAMRNSLWDIVILFMFNFVFFMAAYISFLRRDVR